MSKPLILVVDDEPKILRLVRLELSEQGFQVVAAADGEAALQEFEKHRPDLVVLDILLPGMDGLEVLRRLREASAVPIILLTARGTDNDKVKGLELGADDYVTKPFNPEELTARVRAVLRRAAGGTVTGPDQTITLGDVSVDLGRRLATRNGEYIPLSRTEWQLLQQLCLNAGRVMLHSDLLTRVWGAAYRDDLQYLRVWISRLRQKLEPNPADPQFIKTIQGIGYMLEGVEEPAATGSASGSPS